MKKYRTPEDLPPDASLELKTMLHINQLIGSQMLFDQRHAVDVLVGIGVAIELQKWMLVAFCGVPRGAVDEHAVKIEAALRSAYEQAVGDQARAAHIKPASANEQ